VKSEFVRKAVELLAYDEQMRHYADMRIILDLHDGVKGNNGKFGDGPLVARAVTGGAGMSKMNTHWRLQHA
jgi:hypothetical protein